MGRPKRPRIDVHHAEPVLADQPAGHALPRNYLDHLTVDQQRALALDLDLSGQVQAELLPRPWLVHGDWEAFYHYQAAGPVGGDYCDVRTTAAGDVHFFLGDVAGKGLAASLLVAHLQGIVRSLIELDLPLSAMVERANRILRQGTGGYRFASLVCGRASRGGRVEICNAGHYPPLHIGAAGVTSVPAGGIPLGLFYSERYATTVLRLEPGDALLLYTDGITETCDAGGEEYGVPRLARAAEAWRALNPPALVDRCMGEIESYCAGTPHRDDLTLLALQRAA